jgi:uncharacterized membrane protein YbaN (DUF454 family)
MKRWLKLSLGTAFVVLGIAGLLLPFLQGILFLAIGFAILAQESQWARTRLEKLRRRYPQLSATFDQASERTTSILARIGGRRPR